MSEDHTNNTQGVENNVINDNPDTPKFNKNECAACDSKRFTSAKVLKTHEVKSIPTGLRNQRRTRSIKSRFMR